MAQVQKGSTNDEERKYTRLWKQRKGYHIVWGVSEVALVLK